MDFRAFNQWLKDHDMEVQLASWCGCAPDMIKIYKGGRLIMVEDYFADTNYDAMRAELEKLLTLPEIPVLEEP